MTSRKIGKGSTRERDASPQRHVSSHSPKSEGSTGTTGSRNKSQNKLCISSLVFNMKKHLAVFDFDDTLVTYLYSITSDENIEANKAIFADRNQIPSDFVYTLGKWNLMRTLKINTLNARNLTKNQVWDINQKICEGTRVLIEGMEEVIKFLHEDHDIIMLSDNDTLVLKVFLSRVGLLEYFSDTIARNLTLEENGQLVFEDIPKTTCPLGGHFLCKGQVLMDYIKDKNYDTLSYFGDGKNDFCPTTKLSENDRVFPRKNFPLDLKIQENDVQAKVQSWNNGIDLLPLLKH